eukprot:CAMPEP_0194210798 /NCGR_PEP_ID=MMETSP0156-20130528/9115_1 /TAXON_ID=33649 /ORGANISM="Thalassionema nitzschioides, Strain L26-B" /LENGTH=494 /DNA_ID=CAMNT_0038938193 /DNA_START=70 /DNA_END=1554 /DNA_ORIENTATION=+
MMMNAVLPLLLISSSLTISNAEKGVYHPMLRGDLSRFIINATTRVDYSDRIDKPLPQMQKKKNIPVVNPLYADMNFSEQDVTPWLRDYIRWHHHVRTSPEQMETAKFMVVEQSQLATRGGGIESHLKHLPYYLWLAAKHGRVLLLSNDYLNNNNSGGDNNNMMCGIQEYLRPNLIDWTLPKEEEEYFSLESSSAAVVEIMSDTEHHFYNTLIENFAMNRHARDKIVLVRGSQLSYQIGLDRVWMDSQMNSKIFYYIFQSLFQLADPVQQYLDDTKKHLGLDTTSKEYIGLHVRLPGVYGELYNSYKKGPFLEDPHAYDTIEAKMVEVGTKALARTKQFVNNDDKEEDDDIPVYVAGDTVESMDLWTMKQEEHPILYNPDAFLFAHNNNDNDNGHGDDGDDCTRFYPELVDLWILSEAKCIGFGNDDVGALATMMNGFGCWTLYERNAVISSMGPQSPFMYLPTNTMEQLLSGGPDAVLNNSNNNNNKNALLQTS